MIETDYYTSNSDTLEMVNLADAAQASPALEEMEERLHRWMEGTRDPFEYSRRGPRVFLDLGQQFANSALYEGWGVA